MVAVVGAGIAGLAAALALVDGPPAGAGSGPRPRVVVLEAGEGLGGKIRTDDVDGRPAEAGPDAFLARVPEAVELCRRLGLAGELVAPAASQAWLWARGRLRPLPAGLVLGVPTRPLALVRSGILSPLGLARAALDLVLPAMPGASDRSVGQLVRARLGDQVLERLVDPLLGGINAGSADDLSLAAAAPKLDAASRRSASLVLSLRGQVRSAPPAGPGPAFLTHPGGLGRVVERLAAHLGASDRVTVRTLCPVTALRRPEATPTGPGWELATPAGPVTADAVVLAVPAFVAADLLAAHAPVAARHLASIDYASVSLVTLAYPASALDRTLEGSGYLVPRSEGRLTTACTWLWRKWPHMAGEDQRLFRVSMGRWGDDRASQLDDEELAAAAHRELVAALGLSRRPGRQQVVRWPRALPQYRPGHLDRWAEVQAGLDGLGAVTLAGAACGRVGIPACIASGQAAVRRLGL